MARYYAGKVRTFWRCEPGDEYQPGETYRFR